MRGIERNDNNHKENSHEVRETRIFELKNEIFQVLYIQNVVVAKHSLGSDK